MMWTMSGHAVAALQQCIMIATVSMASVVAATQLRAVPFERCLLHGHSKVGFHALLRDGNLAELTILGILAGGEH